MTGRRAEYPLTFGQLSVWRIMEGHPLHRWPESYLRTVVPVPSGASLHDVVDALDVICARHETLRTHFLDGDAGPRQRIAPVGTGVDPVVVDRDDADSSTAAAVCEELARDRIERTIEFGRRFAVVRVAGRPAHVAIVVDHIVADGHGLNRLRGELTALLGGADPDGERWLAEDPPPQPRELAEEQRSVAGLPRRQAAVDHWRGLLRTLPAEIFPVPRSAGESPGRIEAILRSRRVWAALAVVSATTRVSPQNTLLALSAVATAAVTGSRRIVLTLQSGNRFSPRWKGLVSSMNQYAPLHLDLALDGTSFATFATTMQTAALRAYRQGSYDIDAITDLVRAERDVDLGFDNFFNFMAHDVPSAACPVPDVPGRIEETCPYRQIGPRFDIKVRGGAEMPIVARVDPGLLPRAGLLGLLRWFDDELHRLATHAGSTVDEVLARCALAAGKRRVA